MSDEPKITPGQKVLEIKVPSDIDIVKLKVGDGRYIGWIRKLSKTVLVCLSWKSN